MRHRKEMERTFMTMRLESVAGQVPQSPDLVPPEVTATGALRRLLNTSIELFAVRGYYGVSVRDIASAMGVQPSSLYAHFRSKEQLLSHLALMANDGIRERIRRALLDSDPDPPTQLRSVVLCYVTFHAEYPLLATIGHNDLHVLSGDSFGRVMASRKEAADLLRAVIVRGNEAGSFRCAQPWLAVAAVVGASIRLASWYRPPSKHPDVASEGYPAEVRGWMPTFTTDEVANNFADYALGIVGFTLGASLERPR